MSINALCDDELDWEDEYIVVDDGGACYWQATFSYFTLELVDLSVNGDA